MPDQVLYTMDAAINGVMAVILYALVALGFVLIFISLHIFRFARRVSAVFAALMQVRSSDGQGLALFLDPTAKGQGFAAQLATVAASWMECGG